VVIQPDGKIVVAGHTESSGQFDIAVVRYNADGSLDTSFDTDGIVTTPVGGNNDEVYGLAVQSDGKMIVAGRSLSGTHDIMLVRYNGDGSLDTGFDVDGKVTTAIGSGNDEARAVVIQPDGKIVVAGHTESSGQFDITVVRYNADGSLDTSFDTDGIVTTPVGGNNDEGYGIARQGDGKIVVVGRSGNPGLIDIVVVRYNADGSPDTAFSGDGIVTTAIGIADDEAYAVSIQGDGKIVVAGRSEQSGTFDIALARYEAASSSSNGGSTNLDSGGGCTMNPRGGLDVTLVGFMGLVLVLSAWKILKEHLKK
jgi:uncharacterized delta-60 repeat protein